jgi:hypothetical protein
VVAPSAVVGRVDLQGPVAVRHAVDIAAAATWVADSVAAAIWVAAVATAAADTGNLLRLLAKGPSASAGGPFSFC